MSSYQDLEMRLAVVERKLAFVMDVIKAQKQEFSYLDPAHPKVTTVTLEQLYRDASAQLGMIVEEPVNGPDSADTNN